VQAGALNQSRVSIPLAIRLPETGLNSWDREQNKTGTNNSEGDTPDNTGMVSLPPA